MSAKAAGPSDTSPKKFEVQLKELESIVDRLENDMPPLDEALEVYETGVLIAKDCLERLDKAELKIKNLKLED